jgi:hypothetical protein
MSCSMEILNFLENCEQEERIKSASPSILPNDLIMRIIQEADGGLREHQQKFQGVLHHFTVPLGEDIDYDPALLSLHHPVSSQKGVFQEELENEWVFSAFEEWNLPMVLFLFEKHIDEFMENDSLIKLLAQDGNKTAIEYLSERVEDDY